MPCYWRRDICALSENGVAFGASRLGVDYHMHGANEYLAVDEIVRSAELFALTIVALCGEHAEPM